MVLIGGAFGRCLSHQSGVLTNVISAVKEAPESSLALSDMLRQKETPATHKRVLTGPCWDPDLRLPASETEQKHFCL